MKAAAIAKQNEIKENKKVFLEHSLYLWVITCKTIDYIRKVFNHSAFDFGWQIKFDEEQDSSIW